MVNFDECRKLGEQVGGSTAISKYETTILNMKRLVGLAFDDPRAQREMKKAPFECVPMPHALGGPPSVAVKLSIDGEDKIIPVEHICGMVIHHMGMIAAKAAAASTGSGTDPMTVFPQDWVVAIPPFYTDAQRRGLLTGCSIVGINGVQRLMHENTATALAYGIFKDIRKEFTKEKPTHVMFIDIGASAFTVTIAVFEPGKLIVKSVNYDENLGGRDFDEAIANWLADKFAEKYKGKLSGSPKTKPKVFLKLLAAAEKAKKTLSPQGVREASVNLECLMDDFDFHIMLQANDYEAMCAPLLARLEGPITKALEEAKIESKDLDSVELVGGTTRIGFVKDRLMAILKVNTLSTTMNADEAVARGAALQSAILSPRFKVLPYEIVECQPLPIKLAWDEEKGNSGEKGVEVDGEADGAEMPTNSVVMFSRGLNFPIVRRVTLRRSGDFTVDSSYDASAANFGFEVGSTLDIAKWTIKGPSGDEKKVRVNVKQDIHGIITLSSAQMVEEIEDDEGDNKDEAKDENGDKKKKVKRTNLDFAVVKPLDWSKAEVDKFQEMEVAMSNLDRVVQETSDMRNELESYIYSMRDKIVSDSHLGRYATQNEKDTFANKNDEIESWLYEDGFDAAKSVYASKLDELKKLGEPIQRRALEAEARPNAVAALQKAVEQQKTWLNDAQASDDYKHISYDEFSTCYAKCDEISSWLYDMIDKQGALGPDADPAFTVLEANTKTKELTNSVNALMRKPKPKVTTPAPEEKPKDPAPEPPKADPMDTDDGGKMDVE
jgi:heat shock protein 4